MPSKPKSLSKRVRVRHVSGVEKDVLRSRLPSLSPNWTRVRAKRTTRKKASRIVAEHGPELVDLPDGTKVTPTRTKSSAKPVDEPSASTSTVPGQPDSDKE
jgi:hypothetical protein